ncbi:MAG: hypothetical protein L0Y57_07310 [Beijerinckiaceae bacterium]|nr:hypothetical protein [Beijerinckiaceae bacterium]
MKLRAPDGCCSVSYMGEAVEISRDGSVAVEEAVAEVLLSHGFTLLDDTKGSTNLAAAGGDPPRRHGQNSGQKSKRQKAPGNTAAPAGASLPGVETPESTVIAAVLPASAGNIPALNRRELFALLRAKKVPVSLPITNDELRALARRACSG